MIEESVDSTLAFLEATGEVESGPITAQLNIPSGKPLTMEYSSYDDIATGAGWVYVVAIIDNGNVIYYSSKGTGTPATSNWSV